MKAKEAVTASISILSSAISDLSDLSKSINTDLITDMGLIKAIKSEKERIEQVALFEIDLEIKGEPVFMDSKKELIIFRIIQEALNNVIKHSKATKVRLVLDYREHALLVEIHDNGIGFDMHAQEQQERKGNAGLKNMETRTRLFGGDIMIETQAPQGTKISVTIPY